VPAHFQMEAWMLAAGPRAAFGLAGEEAAVATQAGHRDVSPGAGGERTTAAAPRDGSFRGWRLLKVLTGSGDKIGLFTLPFLLAGLFVNIVYPSVFSVGGPSTVVRVVSFVVLVPGLAMWVRSGALILRKVPRGELITNGPYSMVKHPLYTSVALLVLPWVGFIFNTWLGAVIGIVLYIGSRIFAPAEEAALSKTFGVSWDEYCNTVKIPWL
jgi:protein-S-isoprenylcysteine O-methyltransferase Ste14